ncbi:hypothetical protein [Rhizobium sp. L1K21]|uniref:hypothetical protein n=1 Tax=Rhizobium sp. L1K21 TaxID=2954933 RepID=UPI002092C317|nr:hypothetical protein [Rhizobium sp. L1K21]MCO6186279.1 hypothetical protein [Rhizobium sp. L1K21]
MPVPTKVPASEEPLFQNSLAALPDRYAEGYFGGKRWGVTLKRSDDQKRIWLYAEELGGSDIVSFNAYRLSNGALQLRPCEMSSEKVVAFVLGFIPDSAA